ncbi:MAG: hypothetical protein QG670_1626 [Thermoproteota archaeon]|nr:hypothetical protein [Thermoproteota archaeon]
MYDKQKGRCNGISRSYYPSLNSMVLLACEHDIDPKLLADAFFEALENEIAYCGSLKIACRNVNCDSAIFLITKEEKVVGQFPINLEIIENENIRNLIKGIPLPERPKKTDELGRYLKINELRYGMKGINATAEIIEIPPSRIVTTWWGTEATVSNIRIADETGSIRLSLWNQQIKTVNIGDEIDIKNCSVSSFAGEPQLRLRRKSTMLITNQFQQSEIQHPIAE